MSRSHSNSEVKLSGAPALDRVGIAVALAYVGIGGALLAIGSKDDPNLHTMLDTAVFVVAGILAWMSFDVGTRMRDIFLRWLAMVFAILATLNFLHMAVAVEWTGIMAPIATAESVLRPATWPPAALLLPICVGTGLVLLLRDLRPGKFLAIGLLLVSAGLMYGFYVLPRYTAPAWLGITRPALVLVPLLWVPVGSACWYFRANHRLLPTITLAAMVVFSGSLAMLYSQAPHDTPAMVAHLAKFSADLIVLLGLVQIASADMQQRVRAERALAQLNGELESRVLDRTAELESANQLLQGEIGVREAAEQKIVAQVERLNLLHQITRAIGERQDLQSIFQVVLRHVEDSLPIDFGCICLYNQPANTLHVIRVGVKSEPIASDLTMTEQSVIPIDANGLSRCVRGQLVYEPDISMVQFPFPQRLARGGLRSLVAAPLLVESNVFGVLIAARNRPDSFSSGECEFLRQLSEHTALAAHQAQLHGALQRAYDDLHQTQQAILQQERLRALGQMASGIAHDINNAISPVALYTESLLETESGLSARARGYLETIQHAVEDVTHTVARMGEFYREREPELTLLPVNVNKTIQQVMDLTRARWSDMPQQRGIVINVVPQLAPESPAMMGIESEVREALINLVFNAVDAMPDGGTVTLRTSVAAGREGTAPRVQIEVEDTGVGMDEETRRRCLEPFFTTKGQRGTGLGLAMVYGIVQRHGADMEIRSSEGKGTTINLSFASASEHVATTPEIDLARPPRLRLLVIDDDPLLTKSLRDILETDGHVVTTANGAQAGIDLFRASHTSGDAFAFVITDLGMPYVDGRQVAQAIKAISRATPVILLTGWGQRLVAEGDVPLHVDLVLNKPPKLRELRRAFIELIRQAAIVDAP